MGRRLASDADERTDRRLQLSGKVCEDSYVRRATCSIGQMGMGVVVAGVVVAGVVVAMMSPNGRAKERERPGFNVATEQIGEGVRLVLRGDLDLSSAREFERAVSAAHRSQPATMIVDLSGLDFLDSRGLRAILSASEACEAQGCELRVIAGEQSRRLFDMTGLSETLPLFSGEGKVL
jgi:anti-sigma B factor antagonist